MSRATDVSVVGEHVGGRVASARFYERNQKRLGVVPKASQSVERNTFRVARLRATLFPSVGLGTPTRVMIRDKARSG